MLSFRVGCLLVAMLLNVSTPFLCWQAPDRVPEDLLSRYVEIIEQTQAPHTHCASQV